MTSENKTITRHRQAMREFDWQVRSNRPLISIISHEEERILQTMKEIAIRPNSQGKSRNWTIIQWDVATGLSCDDPSFDLGNDFYDAANVITWFQTQKTSSNGSYLILVLKDFHKYIGYYGNPNNIEHTIIRQIRNFCELNKGQHKTIVFLGTNLFLPPELEKIASVIDWPLPEKEHIEDKISNMLNHAEKHKELAANFKTKYDSYEMDEIIRAFLGLTLTEVEYITTYMMLTQPCMDPKTIASKKRDVIRKSGVIEWIDVDTDLNSVGGLQELKKWLNERKDAFTREAVEYGLPANPKGLLMIGIQGGGKSLCAKAIASAYNLPLLRLDMGKVLGSYVGQSEENIRSVIKVAESIAPCILWADEIDKALSGIASSNQTDGGTTSRVFATILTWMQEKTSPVYVVATANNVSQLPPELLRKGRFDEIFFVDLPSEEDRKDIFRIHLSKMNRNPEDFDVHRLARKSSGYTGAEIEASIVSALYKSFSESKRNLTTIDIEHALLSTIPIAVMMKENIDELRNWAEQRARNASIPRIIEPIIQQTAKDKKQIMANIDKIEDEEEL